MNEKKHPNILIAEDVESNFLYLKAVLSKLNATIFWAKNGIEAVEICENDPIDLVFMDLQMPEMNGYEATRQIRSFNKKVIIIAQTAFGLITDQAMAIEAGCNDYISKPVRVHELNAIINKHTAKK